MIQNIKLRKYLFLLFGMSFMCSACGELKLGGLTAKQSFSKPLDSQLIYAAIDEDFAEVDRLVKAGANVNAVGSEGLSPLMWLIAAKAKKGLEKLLQLGANPNYKTDIEFSAMELAAQADDIDYLKILLRHGGDPNITCWNGMPLLQRIANGRNWKRIDFLLDNGADLNGVDNQGGTIADHVVAVWGRYDKGLFYLEKGTTVELERLAQIAVMVNVPDSQQIWYEKLLAALKQRGVEIPEPRK
ncbi:MAG: hypothetical protein OEZ58_10190 [Gammaproteobacteria bacterium]|nr:hypothetical protein [Gammaproteobacteria bacterium]MDH5729350.1 hypothetical protein [Gammaproteobacteria bacterium]